MFQLNSCELQNNGISIARTPGLGCRRRIPTWRALGYKWRFDKVDGIPCFAQNAGYYKFNPIAIDLAGHAHTAYVSVSYQNEDLRYGYWNDASWAIEV